MRSLSEFLSVARKETIHDTDKENYSTLLSESSKDILFRRNEPFIEGIIDLFVR
jgi:hypothetical protein